MSHTYRIYSFPDIRIDFYVLLSEKTEFSGLKAGKFETKGDTRSLTCWCCCRGGCRRSGSLGGRGGTRGTCGGGCRTSCSS